MKAGAGEPLRSQFNAWKRSVHKRVEAESVLMMPTLIYWGRNDPSAVLARGLELFDVVAEQNPKVRMIVVNKAGHFHFREYRTSSTIPSSISSSSGNGRSRSRPAPDRAYRDARRLRVAVAFMAERERAARRPPRRGLAAARSADTTTFARGRVASLLAAAGAALLAAWVSLLTVAQARRSASLRGTPRSS